MCCLERCPAIGASDLVCLGRNQAAPRRTVGAVQPFLGTNVPRRVDWNDGLMRLMCVFFFGGVCFLDNTCVLFGRGQCGKDVVLKSRMLREGCRGKS